MEMGCITLTLVECIGGKAGLGLGPYPHGFIEKFISTGEGIPRPGEWYKQSPELALEFMDNIPKVPQKKYVVFRPLDEVGDTWCDALRIL